MKILFVNACIRDNSRTLRLAKHLLSKLSGEITEVRLQDKNISPLNKESLKTRDSLLQNGHFSDESLVYAREFAQADIIVIAAPYWDLSFPAFLKIYLEAVTVAGITFCYENDRPKGLCHANKLYYVTTAGGPIVADFGFSYIKALAENLYVISDVIVFSTENLDIGGADAEVNLEQAKSIVDKTL